MKSAETEHLLDKLMTGELNDSELDRLRQLGEGRPEIQDELGRQDLVRRGLEADRSALLRTAPHDSMRSYVEQLSRSTGTPRSGGVPAPSAGMSGFARWGIGIATLAAVLLCLYFILPNSGSDVEVAQPAQIDDQSNEVPQAPATAAESMNGNASSDAIGETSSESQNPASSATNGGIQNRPRSAPATQSTELKNTQTEDPSASTANSEQAGTEKDTVNPTGEQNGELNVQGEINMPQQTKKD